MMWRLAIISLILVSETSAYEVDLRDFGNCNLNLNILNPNAGIEIFDLASEVIIKNKKFRLWTFHDSKNGTEITRLSLESKAPCTLHVLLGTRDEFFCDLKKINTYYQNSPLHSRIILISLDDFEFAPFNLTIAIRPRIFLKRLYSASQDVAAPWFYFCPYCFDPNRFILVNELALEFVSTLSFKNIWAQPTVHTKLPSQLTAFVSNCISLLWSSSFLLFTLCYHSNVLFEAIVDHYNFTVSDSFEIDSDGEFFIYDLIIEKLIDESKTNTLGVDIFHLPQIEPWYLLYCEEKLRFNEKSAASKWFSPFSATTWLGFGVTISAVLLFNVVCKGIYLKPRLIPDEIFSVVQVLLRQAPSNCGLLLMVVTFGTIIISTNYENYITSELTVPPENGIIENLGQLIKSKFKIVLKVKGNNYEDDEKVRSKNLVQFESAFRSYGIKISKDHFLVKSETDDPSNIFSKLVLTGHLIALPIDAGYVRDVKVLITFQTLVGVRFHCAIIPEGFYFKAAITSYYFHSHITEHVKDFATRWEESGTPQIFSKFSNHFGPLIIKRLKRHGKELQFQREYESASWYNPARYPYIPVNWFGEDATYITLFNLRSFFSIYLGLFIIAFILFSFEAPHCILWAFKTGIKNIYKFTGFIFNLWFSIPDPMENR